MDNEFDEIMKENSDVMNAGRMMELELLSVEIKRPNCNSLSDAILIIDNRIKDLNNG